MSNQIYQWKRFWCPRTSSINLSDGGYLYNPDSEWGHIYNPDVVPFESITETPCLALLGEPGIGKSYAMQTERDVINAKTQERGKRTLWLDLRSYGSDGRLVRDLFKSPMFVSWTKGEYPLQVFLDSFDECLLRIDNLAALLADEFRKYPVKRLHLRIACRTAEWPNGLEMELRQLWHDAFEVYELTPLRRVDVIEAANSNDLDSRAFLEEIDRMEAVPLAIKPVTLSFLINTYRQNGRFPRSQVELYSEGCRLLCEETSPSRRDAGLTGNLTAKQRMAVAARIAAVTVFGNRYAVWTGLDWGEVPDEDTMAQELCGGTESVNGEQFKVNEAGIKETLTTGLFSSRGRNRIGWSHQTYAEFLAARYLVQSRMTLDQIMCLILHPEDPHRKLVPQLRETAAWLASMVTDVFTKIMSTDPEVLLRSDVAATEVRVRESLAESLLRLFDEDRLLDCSRDIRRRFRKLAHKDLAEQLRPYICDDSKGVVVRQVAIEIAEACKLQTLQDELKDIALDPRRALPVRVDAAFAVSGLGDEETRAKLKPLATGEARDDPRDELKGCALQATWRGCMTAEELFAALTPPKDQRLIGVYHLFLTQHLIKHLLPVDLPTALGWVQKVGCKHHLPYPFKKLVDAIMQKAWEHLATPGVEEAFATACLLLLKHHDAISIESEQARLKTRSLFSTDDLKRRQVLERVVHMLSDPEKESVWIAFPQTPLVLSKDVFWMIERLQTSTSEQVQQGWATLIHRVFHWGDAEQIEAILVAVQSDPILAKEFAWLIQPIELYSEKAKEMKARYLKEQKWKNREKDRPPLEPPPAERIVTLLNECESGNSEAWWRLNMEMTLEPNSTHYRDELKSDLTVLPGWKAADLATMARIVEAAKRYLVEQDPQTQKWLGTDTFHRPAFAGFRALRLLLKETPAFVTTIPSEVWKTWAPLILAYPTSGSSGGQESQQHLVRWAYQQAPIEMIDALMVIIDKENKELSGIYITRLTEGCWDDRLAKAILIKAKDDKLKPECMGSLVADLLDHKVQEARIFAGSLVPCPPPSGGAKRATAIVAARVLINHAEDAGWSVVWPAIQQDAEFGREVISAAAHGPEGRAVHIGKKLTEDELADLYIWVSRQFPHAEDREHSGWIEPRESVAQWRESVLRQLQHRGTHKACEAIRRIASELPELEWLKWMLLEAQNITRRRTWIPPIPSDILKMGVDQQARLVQSGDQLLDVLTESLKRLGAKLQGETPAAIDLWNEISKGVYRPKDENRFSDYLKRHLDNDQRKRGVIVNREVEIRRGEGPGQGERTDVHVDAALRGRNGEVCDTVTAIIEVKGSWNRDLHNAMKTQLVDRYLRDNRCQYGLYLIGWFNCDQWDNSDYRKKQAPRLGISEAQGQFDSQAAELSKEGARIKAFVMNTALR